MSSPSARSTPRPSRFLAEWYRPDLTDDHIDRLAAQLDEALAAPSPAGHPPVRLLILLGVPADEVVFAVFAAGSAPDVEGACRRAEVPVARLTAATEARRGPRRD
jgi:hypothetical protein